MNFMRTNRTLTIEADGWISTITDDHPYWHQIIEALEQGEFDGIESMTDLTKAIAERADGKVIKVENGNVLINGEVASGPLAQQIRDFIAEDFDFEPLLNFYRKVEANPSDESRENLYRWLATHDFSITADGDIVGFKALKVDGDAYVPTREGYGIVDGVEIEHGLLRQRVGSVVEMPREMVNPDSSVTCSVGLHVATKGYAEDFIGGDYSVTVMVAVDPADVVAVPGDYRNAKMRTCKYTLLGKATDAKVERLHAVSLTGEAEETSDEDDARPGYWHSAAEEDAYDVDSADEEDFDPDAQWAEEDDPVEEYISRWS